MDGATLGSKTRLELDEAVALRAPVLPGEGGGVRAVDANKAASGYRRMLLVQYPVVNDSEECLYRVNGCGKDTTEEANHGRRLLG